MRCIGRTNNFRRCRNQANFLFCHQHKYQKFGLLVSCIVVISTLLINSLNIYGYLKNKYFQDTPGLYSAPTILGFKEDSFLCLWQTLSVIDLEIITINRTPNCPDEIVWSQNNEAIIYREGSKLFWMRWLDTETTRELGEFPAISLTEGGYRDIWISQETGRPRISFLVPSLIKTETKETRTYVYDQKEYVVELAEECELGQKVDISEMGYRRMVTDESEFYIRVPLCPEFYELDLSNTMYGNKPKEKVSLPAWGESLIAIVMELSNNNEWEYIIGAPTRASASRTPGLKVLGPYLESDSDYISLTKQKNQCGEMQCVLESVPELVHNELKAIYRDHKHNRMGYGYAGGGGLIGYLGAVDGFDVFYPVVMGSTLHQTLSITICKDDCKEWHTLNYDLGALRIGDDQVSINRQGKYILVTSEYENENAAVFQVGKADPIYKFEGHKNVSWLHEKLVSEKDQYSESNPSR